MEQESPDRMNSFRPTLIGYKVQPYESTRIVPYNVALMQRSMINEQKS